MGGELTGGDGARERQAPPPPKDVPADWYPDPDAENLQRYWDGARWTDDVAPLPLASSTDTKRPTEEASPAPDTRSPDDDDESDKGSVAAPGWYTDPDETHLRRYWDGTEWTDWTDETYDADDGRSGGEETDPRNDSLATIGWITAIFFPIIGIVVGIILGSRGDSRGTSIVITATVVFIAGIAVWVALLSAAASG
ncbi:MAG: DUF2510 domain-containing protein [Chloroflexota bacterium]